MQSTQNTVILYVPYIKTKSVASVNSEQKSDTTIARTWTEEGDKYAEQTVPSIQNYAEVPKKLDGINKLCRGTKETRRH